jgi:RNA polymerase sigma-70 factor, ECF subfamily
MLSDEALFEALVNGDLRAFDTLYERYERHLFGFIRKHLVDAHEAEDVLHETFMAILRDRAGARAAQSLWAWIFQVARHLCLNRQRSARRATRALEREARSPEETHQGPESALEHLQAQDALRDAVAKLPVEFGELYSLRTQGMSYAEMAEVLGIPLGTVKSRMHQLVKQRLGRIEAMWRVRAGAEVSWRAADWGRPSSEPSGWRSRAAPWSTRRPWQLEPQHHAA